MNMQEKLEQQNRITGYNLRHFNKVALILSYLETQGRDGAYDVYYTPCYNTGFPLEVMGMVQEAFEETYMTTLFMVPVSFICYHSSEWSIATENYSQHYASNITGITLVVDDNVYTVQGGFNCVQKIFFKDYDYSV